MVVLSIIQKLMQAKRCNFGKYIPEKIYVKPRYEFKNWSKSKVKYEIDTNIG